MESLTLTPTISTPEINFDAATGVLVMRGESYPENAMTLYQPLQAWIAEFLEKSTLPVKMEIGLTYLNTSSIRSLMDILDLLEESHKKGRQVRLTWFCDEDNDRAIAMAEEFREEFTLPFVVVTE